MPGHDIIVIGASAGGVEALAAIARTLPADLPAAVFIVLHVPSQGTSVLPAILQRSGKLPAQHAVDGQEIQHGRIYVAPPDRHLLIKPGRIRLVHGPTENGHRPAVDPLFRTAARTYGRRVIGVVLSGVLDDGTAGLLTVKSRGGIAVVQHPDDALFNGMPISACENVDVDHVLPVAQIPALLTELAHRPVEEGAEAMPDEMDLEPDITEIEPSALTQKGGVASGFTCPECHGALWEVHEGELIRFRCRVGHAYTANSLFAEQSEALEAAMWIAFRALKESAALTRKLAQRAQNRGHDLAATRFEEQARDAEDRAKLIRQVLVKGELDAPPEPGTGDLSSHQPEAVAHDRRDGERRG